MKLIIDTKEFSIWNKELPNEIIGYNFYTISGAFACRCEIGKDNYIRAPFRILVNLNGKEVEIPSGQNLYKLDNGKYFIGREY